MKGVCIPAGTRPQQQQGAFWKSKYMSKVVGCSEAGKTVNGLGLQSQQGVCEAVVSHLPRGLAAGTSAAGSTSLRINWVIAPCNLN